MLILQNYCSPTTVNLSLIKTPNEIHFVYQKSTFNGEKYILSGKTSFNYSSASIHRGKKYRSFKIKFHKTRNKNMTSQDKCPWNTVEGGVNFHHCLLSITTISLKLMSTLTNTSLSKSHAEGESKFLQCEKEVLRSLDFFSSHLSWNFSSKRTKAV